MTHTDPFVAYMHRSVELELQQAGLEVVVHIRRAVEGVYIPHRNQGEHLPDAMYLNVRFADNPSGYFPIGKALWYVMHGKSLPEQRVILGTILASYVENGDIPEFRIGEAVDMEGKSHLVIHYGFSL